MQRLLVLAISVVLLTACTSELTEQETLTTFTSAGTEYGLVITPNDQGVDTPCVGVAADFEGGSGSAIACPTEEDEIDEYANAIEFRGRYFVVGYGLEEHEQIDLDDAVAVVTSDETRGRRFFAVHLGESPGTDPFDIPVVAPDGMTRSIVSYGTDT